MKTQNLLDIIRKSAEAGTAPVYHGGGVPAQNNIVDMQQQLKNVIQYINQYGLGTNLKGISDQEKDARKSFNDFMINSYANNGLHGYERDQGEDSDPLNMADPQGNLNITERLMDSLNLTGGKLDENKTDGHWDYRTNNALKDVYAYTSAVSNTVKAFRINAGDAISPLSTISKNILKSDRAANNQEVMDPAGLKTANQRAANIKPALNAIEDFLKKALYAIFTKNSQLLLTFNQNAPIFTQKGNQKAVDTTRNAATTKALADYNKIPTESKAFVEKTLKDDLDTYLQTYKSQYLISFTQPIRIGNNPTVLNQIHLWYLLSKENFKSFLQKWNYPSDDATINKVLNMIAKQSNFSTNNLPKPPQTQQEQPGQSRDEQHKDFMQQKTTRPRDEPGF
jgi:hypothetical protein